MQKTKTKKNKKKTGKEYIGAHVCFFFLSVEFRYLNERKTDIIDK